MKHVIGVAVVSLVASAVGHASPGHEHAAHAASVGAGHGGGFLAVGKAAGKHATMESKILHLLGAEDKWEKCEKSWTIALLLTIFLFGFGAGRFYVGHMVWGCVQLGVNLVLCGVSIHASYELSQAAKDQAAGEAGDTAAAARSEGEAKQGFMEGGIAGAARCLFCCWWIVELVMFGMGMIVPSC